MNLIEKFENMPVQDVGTFNSIFTASPIMVDTLLLYQRNGIYLLVNSR